MTKKKPASPKKTGKKKAPEFLPEKQTFAKRLKALRFSVAGKMKPAIPVIKKVIWYTCGILVVTAGLLTADLFMDGHIIPRVQVGPINLGFMTMQEATNAFQNNVSQYLKTPLQFTAAGKQAEITPQELGVTIAIPQTLQLLPSFNLRNSNPVLLLAAIINNHNYNAVVSFDIDRALQILQEKLDITGLRAVNARLVIDNQKNYVISPEAPGKIISRSQLLALLGQSAANLQPLQADLQLEDENPSVTAAGLSAQKDNIIAQLKNPLTFFYEGQKWKFDPQKHLDGFLLGQTTNLHFKQTGWTLPIVLGGEDNPINNDIIDIITKPEIVLDTSKIEPVLNNEIIEKIKKPASDVKIYRDSAGEIVIEGKGQNGLTVEAPRLLASVAVALNNNISRIDVPVYEEKANVTVSKDLQDMGIKNLIATGHTAFAGSHPGRVHNINTGIMKYNGLLVKSGEIFSFNDHLGPVDAAHGFTPELVIKAEGTVPEYGGGLCQVSSTLFRAAIYGGFPIVERAPHSYAVSYYAQIGGYGLDGTIYPGVHDIKFLNDSPGYLIIQSYTEGDQAYFKFYGTDDGRKVWMEGPYVGNYRTPGPTEIVETDKLPPGGKKQVEINHTGFDVTWYRYIVKNDKQIKEKIFSRYQAIPAKIMVGKSGETVQASVPKV